MYRSVGIRDTRESLRLGASMWRRTCSPPSSSVTILTNTYPSDSLLDYFHLPPAHIPLLIPGHECRHLPKQPVDKMVLHHRSALHGHCSHLLVPPEALVRKVSADAAPTGCVRSTIHRATNHAARCLDPPGPARVCPAGRPDVAYKVGVDDAMDFGGCDSARFGHIGGRRTNRVLEPHKTLPD